MDRGKRDCEFEKGRTYDQEKLVGTLLIGVLKEVMMRVEGVQL